MMMNPSLKQKQASECFNHTIQPNNKDLLMQNDVKAQVTTTKRSAITVLQQFCWFKTYGNALDELRKCNVGTCNQTGKTFGELIQHFVVGGDKTCIMSSAGELTIVGSTPRHKVLIRSLMPNTRVSTQGTHMIICLMKSRLLLF
jgi:hypothetical protein